MSDKMKRYSLSAKEVAGVARDVFIEAASLLGIRQEVIPNRNAWAEALPLIKRGLLLTEDTKPVEKPKKTRKKRRTKEQMAEARAVAEIGAKAMLLEEPATPDPPVDE